MKECDRESACTQTDTLTHWQTDWQTQTDCYSCGTDKKKKSNNNLNYQEKETNNNYNSARN